MRHTRNQNGTEIAGAGKTYRLIDFRFEVFVRSVRMRTNSLLFLAEIIFVDYACLF